MSPEEKALRDAHSVIYKEWGAWRKAEFHKIREPYNRDVLPLIKAYKVQYKEYCDRVAAKHEEMLGELVAELEQYN